jgi:hypothetical protein
MTADSHVFFFSRVFRVLGLPADGDSNAQQQTMQVFVLAGAEDFGSAALGPATAAGLVFVFCWCHCTKHCRF